MITFVVLHNMCQFNGDEYVDEDEVLEQVLRQERKTRQKRKRQRKSFPWCKSNKACSRKLYWQQLLTNQQNACIYEK